MSPVNPYNCTEPGNLFVGYEQLLLDIIDGFSNGHSFAVLGGRRCGKTSLLLEIEKRLKTSPPTHFKPVPGYLDVQGLSQRTPDTLFRAIYELVVQSSEAPLWVSEPSRGDYQNFLQHLDKAQPVLGEKHGDNWLAVLLVDELDTAKFPLSDDQFFQNLRNLLMVSRFHRHFRLVATGVKELAALITSGSSPLNNLRTKYLRVLSGKEARQLINHGFPNGLEPEVEQFLIELTGRHPYLLQGMLEKLWARRDGIERADLRKAAREFLKEHNDFQRWSKSFEPAEHAVYQLLLQAREATLHVNKIQAGLPAPLASQMEEALTVLSYHGVIDDSEPDEPRIVSLMFRDWYLQNQPVKNQLRPAGSTKRGGRMKKSETPSPAPKKKGGGRETKRRAQIFISYAREDRKRVEEIYKALHDQGYLPWLDKENLKGGQDWQQEIEIALEKSDLAILCLSKKLVDKRSFIQREIRKLLELVEYMPERSVFLIPVRLDKCDYPRYLRDWHIVDLFEPDGITKLTEAIRAALESQKRGKKS